MSSSSPGIALRIVALAGGYVLAARLGLELAAAAEQVTLVWPATGIALGALVIGGARLWPGVLLGAFVANLWVNAPPLVALSIAVGNTLEALLGRWLLARAKVEPPRWTVREALWLAAIATLVSTPVGALWGITSLCAGGLQPWSALGPLWLDWWIGDAVGALVIAPVILTFGVPEPPRSGLEATMLLAGAGGIVWLGYGVLEPAAFAYPVHHLAFPFVLWAALRFGPRTTAVLVLVVATIEVGGTVSGQGPFGDHPTQVGLMIVQLNVAMLAGSSLVLAAVSVERRRLMAELGARAEQLEARDRFKNEFLAMLGHELRNPLAPIVQATRLMAEPASDHHELQRLRGVIDRQSRQLERLVDDLLDVARISSGRIAIVRSRIELGPVIDAAVEASQPGLDAAGVTLTTTITSEPLWVLGDGARLGQVVANLLNNAARYTPRGGHAWLELRREHDEAVIRVRDDGVGMTPEVIEHAFELFAQGPTTSDHAPGGLGIGLTLVRTITRLHHGTIEAKSDGPGRGSELVVRLPLVTPAEEAAEPAPEPVREPMPAREPTPTPTPMPNASRHVLVVDDSEDAADTLALWLEADGHRVRVAYDGPRALELARAEPPEIVLLDVGLPGMSGHEVARAMRSEPALAHALLVAITGYGQPEDARAAKEAGFDRHLVKPVDPQLVSALVQRYGNDGG